MAKQVSATHKLGKSRAGERTRVWLEGKRLLAAGFTHRRPFIRTWRDGFLMLTVCSAEAFEATPRNERGTVAGSPERPIIDITGEQVAATFTGEHVSVTYREGGTIIIKGV